MARARTTARVYTPPPEAAAYPQHHHDEDGGGVRQLMVLVIMLIVMVTGGYVLWTLYGGPQAADAPVIEANAGGFKERYDGPPVDELSTTEIDRALEGRPPAPAKAAPARAAVEEPLTPLPTAAVATPVTKGPPPRTAGDGGFLVQIAALRSEGAADTAWDRLARRDPALFANARKDVQRADLGGKGVYWRVRAGYFADRGEATRFCDRVKTLGQECIVVVR